MNFCFTEVVLGKHEAQYFQCKNCGLIQPENPFWLPESYESAIAASDVGLALRNKHNLIRLELVLHRLHGEVGRILDVGGGYGLLCRSLRDIGFDCYTTDIYCENLFAISHEPNAEFQADTLLAFEVFEHIADPFNFVKTSMEEFGAKRFVFSTLTHSGDTPPLRDWWYYAFETGQHISLYHEKSLVTLADQLALHYFSISPDLHVLSQLPINSFDRFFLDLRGRVARRLYQIWTGYVRKGKSFTQSDYEQVKAQLRGKI